LQHAVEFEFGNQAATVVGQQIARQMLAYCMQYGVAAVVALTTPLSIAGFD
jgi:isocitrate dehydrogenase